MRTNLRVLTLNCWGLPFITPQKNRRLNGIIDVLRSKQWDVVCLQEVWLRSDRRKIIKNSGFAFHKAFNEGQRFFGSGMLVMSRFPIKETDFYSFRVTGFPHKFSEGDFHAGKGVGYVLVSGPEGDIPVFCTHLIAKYSRRHEGDPNRLFRISQVVELVLFIRKKVQHTGFILCGDLNAENHDLEVEAIYGLFGIPWADKSRIRSDRKKLDHVLCGTTGDQSGFSIVSQQFEFRKKRKFEFNYSDHYGVSAVVRYSKGASDHGQHRKSLERVLRYLRYSINIVHSINRWVSWIPIFGMVVKYFMTPQLRFIEAQISFIETGLKNDGEKSGIGLSSTG